MLRCPCGELLPNGVLRCRACGRRAAELPHAGVRSGFRLDDLLSDDQVHALELLDELRELAPAVALWLRQDPETRGPLPDVRPKDAGRVEELLAELRKVRARI